MAYGMTLICDGREVTFPVLPEKVEVSASNKNEKVTVLGLGEVLVLNMKGLKTIAWEGFFPARSAPYVTGSAGDTISSVRAIQEARDSGEPARFLITGTDLDCNEQVGIETFDYEERGGEVGDIYYSIKLTQWKNTSPKKIVLPAKPKEPAKVQETKRPAAKPKTTKKYTVKSGDCLWTIAQRYYGKGSDWKKIYNANKGVIGSNPNLIYPGQVYTIP